MARHRTGQDHTQVLRNNHLVKMNQKKKNKKQENKNESGLQRNIQSPSITIDLSSSKPSSPPKFPLPQYQHTGDHAFTAHIIGKETIS